MGSFDGGSSLKRVDHSDRLVVDTRSFESDYYLSEEQVDKFKNDVKPRPRKAKGKQPEVRSRQSHEFI